MFLPAILLVRTEEENLQISVFQDLRASIITIVNIIMYIHSCADGDRRTSVSGAGNGTAEYDSV